MISSKGFNLVRYGSYNDLKNLLDRSKQGRNKEIVNKTLSIIENNPFKEDTIDLLLNEEWICQTDGVVWSTCDSDKKLIRINRDLISKGRIYDFYERDIHLMHELNHAWFGRFKINSIQECLSDKFTAYSEFENRLINEYISRENRAKPLILKKAIESFGLEPQIYDVASKMAFENNLNVRISKLAKKDPSLLKTLFLDGPDNHYYKQALKKLFKNSKDEFWKEFSQYEDIVWERTLDFLINKHILDPSPIGNYGFLTEKNELEPAIDVDNKKFYFKDKNQALNYIEFMKKTGNFNARLVKISEVNN